jgi:hypothetical protein
MAEFMKNYADGMLNINFGIINPESGTYADGEDFCDADPCVCVPHITATTSFFQGPSLDSSFAYPELRSAKHVSIGMPKSGFHEVVIKSGSVTQVVYMASVAPKVEL